MKTFELVVPCHFGLEAVTKQEIHDLGYEVGRVTDGRVGFLGDADAIARANVFLRTGERVLLKVGAFRALSFEELFQKTRRLPWEEYIPLDGKFWVTKASAIRSRLYSTRDIQSVMKKAIVARLSESYRKSNFPETGAKYPIRVFNYKDEMSVYLDTSGDSLHKRGYRLKMGKAPITETLAAALLMLSGWKPEHPLVDPMCGSGTFPIEAAMMAANVAPGMDRGFISEAWTNFVPKKYWYQAVEEANDEVDRAMLEGGAGKEGWIPDIQGYDIDPEVLKAARENARRAGVDKMVHFQARDIVDTSHRKRGGFLILNPPYGERMEDTRNLPLLYTQIRQAYESLEDWQLHLLTGWEDAERYLGKSERNRKVYNGMMKTYFYSYGLAPKMDMRAQESDEGQQAEDAAAGDAGNEGAAADAVSAGTGEAEI